jgi:galactose mutarotase-like enzyme
MKVSLHQTTVHDLSAWVLENEYLRTAVVPELGAKIVSIVDKRSRLEWLVGPGSRLVKKVPYGAVFSDQDLSGWDEMFPTIVACEYPSPGDWFGTSLPDHGEVWTQPWTVIPTNADTLKLSVEGIAIPYRLTLTLAYNAPATLQMRYELVNLGRDRMPYIWAAHPQFECGEEAEIVFPPQVKEVCNTIPATWGWGTPETRFDWPKAVNLQGEQQRIDRTGPPSLKQARKFFVVPETRVGWAGLVRRPTGDWLRLDWELDKVPYLGIWVDQGALSHRTVATPEPTTGFYDSLALAWDKNEITVAEPGTTQTWSLTVRFGTREQPFPHDL